MHTIYPNKSLQETLNKISPSGEGSYIFGKFPEVLPTDNKLQRIAKNYGSKIFVDDFLSSFKNAQSAISLYETMEKILTDGGYSTSKLFTNSSEVREALDQSRLLKDENGEIPETTALLGVPWNWKDDTISPAFRLPDKCLKSLHDPEWRVTKDWQQR